MIGTPRPNRIRQLLESRSSWGLVAGYAVVAWVVLQVTDTLASLIGLPFWFGPGVIVLLGAGLLVVLITALLQGPLRRRDDGSAAGRRLRRLFTWRHAAVGGVFTLAALGLITVTYLGARALGIGAVGTLTARGLLPEQAELVLADLEDHAGDPAAAAALTQALRVHLSQSPSFSLLSGTRVADVLERMVADSVTLLDVATAREVAIREGLTAVVGGAIHRVGDGFTISARVIAAESGEELLALLETADGADALIPALERVSLRLRERIGESLVSVRRSAPLSRVRTASLAALKSYSAAADANSRGDFERCALLMEEAIARDSMFAMAYEGRAGCKQNLRRDYAQQIADRVRAFEMRDRMTEHERLRFTAVFHQFVTEDRRQAIEAWEAYAEQYPERTSALFALANLYAEGRDWQRAEETLQQGLERDPSSVIALINLAGYQINLGRLADAAGTYERLSAELSELDLSWWRSTMHLAAGDWDAARAELEAGRERAHGNPYQRASLAALQGYRALTLGRVAEGEAYLREALDAHSELGMVELYYLDLLALAAAYLELRADTAAALSVLDAGQSRHTLESLDPLQRPHLALAEFHAAVGDLTRARASIDAWERDVAARIPGRVLPHWVRASLARAEGRLADAIAEWRLADEESEDPLPALVNIGHLFEMQGEPDSAAAYYERYLRTPSRLRYVTDAYWRGRVLDRLARIHRERGDSETAARYDAALAELWAEADPVLHEWGETARGRMGS